MKRKLAGDGVHSSLSKTRTHRFRSPEGISVRGGRRRSEHHSTAAAVPRGRPARHWAPPLFHAQEGRSFCGRTTAVDDYQSERDHVRLVRVPSRSRPRLGADVGGDAPARQLPGCPSARLTHFLIFCMSRCKLSAFSRSCLVRYVHEI